MTNTNNIEWLRRTELALATLILLYAVLLSIGAFERVAPDNELLDVVVIYGGLFFLPLGLAIVSVLSAVLEKSSGSGIIAMGILLGVLVSWILFYSVASGGVVIGHLLSFAFGLLLAVVVLLKQAG